MNDNVKIAITIAVAIVLATGLYVYFSPYQTCVRSFPDGFAYSGRDRHTAAFVCARAVNSN